MATKSEEIATALAERIGEGRDFPPGSTLPRTDDLVREFGVSKVTVGGAIEQLERWGLVRAVKKAGYLVLQPVERRVVRDVVRRPRGGGYVFPVVASAPGGWVLHGREQVDRLAVPEDIAELFAGIEPGAQALRRRRVSSPPGEPPFQLADTWLHPEVEESAPQLAEHDTGPGGYLEVIEHGAGHGPLSWDRFVQIDMPTADEAQLLQVSRKLPVWRQYTVGVSAKTGRPVEITAVVIPGGRVRYATRLRRDASARWPVEPFAPAPQSFDLG
ncbi:GntR family transcriptional regulator [Streptomyces chartreusis]|uniref:GntR family transcriptional regulator n=1 Tax=Streptomyces chartreusis TaxID=1969 RepID=A0A7H8T9X9_STRCX|nr:GntR family transcriptional regulator [Streptomyces chartreusis]QKZ20291.1 GntR family transcriptional regulator [Streptomyces chartreusis]